MIRKGFVNKFFLPLHVEGATRHIIEGYRQLKEE